MRLCSLHSTYLSGSLQISISPLPVVFPPSVISCLLSRPKSSPLLYYASIYLLSTEGVDFQPIFATLYLSIDSTPQPCIEVPLTMGDGYENPETVSLLVTTMNDSVTIVQNMTEITILNSDGEFQTQ